MDKQFNVIVSNWHLLWVLSTSKSLQYEYLINNNKKILKSMRECIFNTYNLNFPLSKVESQRLKIKQHIFLEIINKKTTNEILINLLCKHRLLIQFVLNISLKYLNEVIRNG